MRDVGRITSDAGDAFAQGWASAQQLVDFFGRGGALTPTFAPGLVLQPGEGFLFQVDATHARLYGLDGSYERTGTFVFGSLGLIGASLATTALVNSSRKNRAALNTIPVWRDQQPCSVAVTTERLMVGLRGVGFQSFGYRAVQEFHADPDNWAVVLGFPDVVPLRLSGPSSAYLGVFLARQLYPEQWQQHPLIGRLGRASTPVIDQD